MMILHEMLNRRPITVLQGDFLVRSKTLRRLFEVNLSFLSTFIFRRKQRDLSWPRVVVIAKYSDKFST